MFERVVPVLTTSDKLCILVALSCLVCGCSSKPELKPIGPVEDNFATHILGDGTKLFRYTILLAGSHQKRQEPREVERRQNSRTGRSDEQDNPLEAQMIAHLEQTLKTTGYCNDQYYELSRVVMKTRAEIRGECHEGATAKDRNKFPNK
ncbi:hypothetical protein HR45_04310 [Shewanella mangrovi]|uniref:Lipoprotein n=1 Tax=Shewanella mangrovi TaxID=1515746 RepID=A0A094JKS0_9GAMM|nr:hypothetical protein [Shewanella mangrovi]KFZ38654.1 hypothetical protein HR45_04310 [Shewanella mangrovi]